jgi:hypothetical protein
MLVQDAGLPSRAVAGQQFLGAGGPGEAPDRAAGQAQLPGDLRLGPALGQQAVHAGVPVPCPAGDPPGPRQRLRRHRRCRLACRRRGRILGPGRGGQVLAVPADRPLDASARLCHRCQRSATWTASGAPRFPPSNGTVRYQNCPNACCRHARIGRSGRVMRRIGQVASRSQVLRCRESDRGYDHTMRTDELSRPERSTRHVTCSCSQFFRLARRLQRWR